LSDGRRKKYIEMFGSFVEPALQLLCVANNKRLLESLEILRGTISQHYTRFIHCKYWINANQAVHYHKILQQLPTIITLLVMVSCEL